MDKFTQRAEFLMAGITELLQPIFFINIRSGTY